MAIHQFSGDLKNIEKLHSFLTQVLEGERFQWQAISAVHEIFINSVLYGNGDKVYLRMEKNDHYYMIAVSEDSEGIIINGVKPPYNEIVGEIIPYKQIYSGSVWANILSPNVVKWEITLERNTKMRIREKGMGLFIARMFCDHMFYIYKENAKNEMILIWKR